MINHEISDLSDLWDKVRAESWPVYLSVSPPGDWRYLRSGHPAFDELAYCEPRLWHAWQEARVLGLHLATASRHCRWVRLTYSRVRPGVTLSRLRDVLAGWYRPGPYNALLSSSVAYELATEALLSCLPPCRGGVCPYPGHRFCRR